MSISRQRVCTNRRMVANLLDWISVIRKAALCALKNVPQVSRIWHPNSTPLIDPHLSDPSFFLEPSSSVCQQRHRRRTSYPCQSQYCRFSTMSNRIWKYVNAFPACFIYLSTHLFFQQFPHTNRWFSINALSHSNENLLGIKVQTNTVLIFRKLKTVVKNI